MSNIILLQILNSYQADILFISIDMSYYYTVITIYFTITVYLTIQGYLKCLVHSSFKNYKCQYEGIAYGLVTVKIHYNT